MNARARESILRNLQNIFNHYSNSEDIKLERATDYLNLFTSDALVDIVLYFRTQAEQLEQLFYRGSVVEQSALMQNLFSLPEFITVAGDRIYKLMSVGEQMDKEWEKKLEVAKEKRMESLEEEYDTTTPASVSGSTYLVVSS